jgi:acid phosphatase (class A)
MTLRNILLPSLIALFLAGPLSAAEKAPTYLNPGAVPDSLLFLPPPPAEGSIDLKRDIDTYNETRKYEGTERWKLATFDADRGANWRNYFRDAFGIEITETGTPATYALFVKVFADLGAGAASAKEKYERTRPYVLFDKPGSTCFPKDEARLSKNGSYPSGHSGYGWGMALILAEISPERQNEILKRGIEIGESRIICGFHWASDVDAGRLVAAAVVAQMHDNALFRERLAKAKAEIKALRENAGKR